MAEPYDDRRSYEYMELAAVKQLAPKSNGNFFGIVIDAPLPLRERTRKGDFKCTVKLADLSTIDHEDPDVRAGITLNCFAANFEQLPHVRRPGDIIRLHRAWVGDYGKPQLVGKLAGPGQAWAGGFSFCLFDGGRANGAAASGAPAPYQCSSARYHFDEREAEILASLCAFSQGGAWRGAGQEAHPLIKIRDVRPAMFYDMVAKVLFVERMPGQPAVLFVWDSTDAAAFPLTFPNLPLDPQQQPQQAANLCVQTLPLAHMDAGALASLPWLGTALPVVVHPAGVDLPARGAWVKLRNLAARVVEGQLQGAYTANSRWSPWLEESCLEDNYRARLRQAARNAVAEWAPAQPADWLSAVHDAAEQPFTPLRRVLADLPAARPTQYRCLLRVLSYQPSGEALPSLCLRAEECWEAAAAEGYTDRAEWLYAGVLAVEDATARVDADLFGRDAELFFSRVAPPGDLRTDADALQRVRGALDATLGKGYRREGARGGPWLDVVLAAFFVDPSRPWETARFRVRYCTLKPPTDPGPALL